MKIYFADANIFLRFILKDNLSQWRLASSYFERSKLGKIKIIFFTEIILEIEYVMRKVYGFPKGIIVQHLSTLISVKNIDIPDRNALRNAFTLYADINIDLTDLVLFFKAQQQGGEVLSFDKDFQKLLRFV